MKWKIDIKDIFYNHRVNMKGKFNRFLAMSFRVTSLFFDPL